MARLWCWLGLHDWLTTYFTAHTADYAEPTSRRCVRCDKEEDWVPEWAP